VLCYQVSVISAAETGYYDWKVSLLVHWILF